MPLPAIQKRRGLESSTITVDVHDGLPDQAHEAGGAALQAALGHFRDPAPTTVHPASKSAENE